MKDYNKDFIIKIIKKKDCYNESINQGFFMILKNKRCNRKLKKFFVVAYGDDIEELKANFEKIYKDKDAPWEESDG